LEKALAWWVRQENENYPRSAIDYQTPQQFEASFNQTPVPRKERSGANSGFPIGKNWQSKCLLVYFLAARCKSGVCLQHLILQGVAGFIGKTGEVESLPIADFKSDASAVPPLGQRLHIRTDDGVVRA
jgi:hypothetical protein